MKKKLCVFIHLHFLTNFVEISIQKFGFYKFCWYWFCPPTNNFNLILLIWIIRSKYFGQDSFFLLMPSLNLIIIFSPKHLRYLQTLLSLKKLSTETSQFVYLKFHHEVCGLKIDWNCSVGMDLIHFTICPQGSSKRI